MKLTTLFEESSNVSGALQKERIYSNYYHRKQHGIR